MAANDLDWYSKYEGYLRGAKPKEQDTPAAQPASKIGAMQRRLGVRTSQPKLTTANKFKGRT